MSGRAIALVATLVVAVPLLAYPLSVLASGSPPFPGHRGECARVATGDGDGELELVFGHLSSIAEANALRERLSANGFANVEVEDDGCGFWKVANDGIDTFDQGRSAAVAAHRAGFDARVELDPGS